MNDEPTIKDLIAMLRFIPSGIEGYSFSALAKMAADRLEQQKDIICGDYLIKEQSEKYIYVQREQGNGEGMPISVDDLEKILDDYFKENF